MTGHYKALKLLPLMYYFELNDIFFFLRCLKDPPPNFDILSYVSFSSNPTRSSSCRKLNHTCSTSNTARFYYFNRLPSLWNSLPPLNLDLSLPVLKTTIQNLFWDHFLANFDHKLPCSYHYRCPCSSCHLAPRQLC